ncbi:MAG: ABC transporter ATP-binding protein [Gemmatimonadota bacterium]|nr:MAG: ABC transporter ATP-binding protein [Gemmatimonadota bacterium]
MSSQGRSERAGKYQPSERPILVAENLHKSFLDSDGSDLPILKGLHLEVRVGEVVAVIGPSGAGKSTMLHLLGGLDRPSGGEVYLEGQPLSGLDEQSLAQARNSRIGFVFQFHHLLREFSALENIMLPLLIGNVERSQAQARGEALLGAVGLERRGGHKPPQLSGGERQRVAVARALANEPLVLLADEPSGNLDDQTAEGLHDLFFRLRDERDFAIVLVTHNREFASRADRVLWLHDGQLHPVSLSMAEHEAVP